LSDRAERGLETRRPVAGRAAGGKGVAEERASVERYLLIERRKKGRRRKEKKKKKRKKTKHLPT
jgi:hypothetical protein